MNVINTKNELFVRFMEKFHFPNERYDDDDENGGKKDGEAVNRFNSP